MLLHVSRTSKFPILTGRCPAQSLDLHQAAHAHLCSSLLKIKGIAESPRLPAEIKPVPKPNLSDEEKSALHNVTSALCNRKHVKDVVEQAIMGTCIALRVPMPEKKGKVKANGKEKTTDKDETKEDNKPRRRKDKQADQDPDVDSDDAAQESGDEAEESEEPILLKRRRVEEDNDNELEDDEENLGDSSGDDEEVFEGFSDSDAEERAFSRYDDLLGGSSDSEGGSEDEASEDESEDLEDSRDKAVRRAPTALDDISISSAEESEAEYSDAESTPPPPPKKTKTKTNTESIQAGRSTFLPSLMGGYVSGSESASDVDVAPSAKKNRRGQRARQAIWEKKYGDKAKHRQNPTPKQQGDARDQGWDMQRGAVDPAGDAKPWKKGIHNPFEKNTMHPERMRHIEHGHRKPQARDGARDRGGGRAAPPLHPRNGQRESYRDRPAPRPRQEPKRDDTGSLHPSWAAAKKAKEEGAKVAFQGRKVTFD